MSMAYNSLEAFFKDNFAMMYYHHIPLGDIEGMLPWERNIYVGLLENKLEEEAQELEKWKT